MADVKIISTADGFDLSYKLGDFESDEGLETGVLVSIFSDRRVTDDELSYSETDRKGWWGDIAIPGEEDNIGSKLWLLERSTLNETTRKLSEEYVTEALQWLLDDGVAESLEVRSTLVPRSRIDISVDIVRPKEKDTYFYRYQLLWESQRLNLRTA